MLPKPLKKKRVAFTDKKHVFLHDKTKCVPVKTWNKNLEETDSYNPRLA